MGMYNPKGAAMKVMLVATLRVPGSPHVTYVTLNRECKLPCLPRRGDVVKTETRELRVRDVVFDVAHGDAAVYFPAKTTAVTKKTVEAMEAHGWKRVEETNV